MAQWRKTVFSMGGPEYINDPRVEEAVALGQLLQQHQAAASAQADRLFARQQDTAQFDERRRQFDEEQKRLASAAKMQQTDNDRQFGLAQQQEQTRAAEASARTALAQQGQAGDAEDRLFRRQQATVAEQRSGASAAEQTRQFEAGRTDRASEIETARTERAKGQRLDQIKDIGDYARRQAEIAGADEQRINADIARMGEKSLDRKADAANDLAGYKAKLDFADARDKVKAEGLLGTEDDQRQRGLGNLVSRFEDDVKTAVAQKDDQTKAEALKAAVERALSPPPDVEGRDNTDVGVTGRRLPVWKPTPADYEALKPVLLEIATRYFPAVQRAGYPMIDIPGSGAPGAGNGLIEQLASLLNRSLFEATGGQSYLNQHVFGVPTWTEELGKQAVDEVFGRQSKNAALFARKK